MPPKLVPVDGCLTCNICGETKPVSDYYARAGATCKECVKERSRKHHNRKAAPKKERQAAEWAIVRVCPSPGCGKEFTGKGHGNGAYCTNACYKRHWSLIQRYGDDIPYQAGRRYCQRNGCREDISHLNLLAKTCSSACLHSISRANTPKLYDRVCALIECGNPLPTDARADKEYCTTECAKRAQSLRNFPRPENHTCLVCGVDISHRKAHARFCSKKCDAASRYVPTIKECKICGGPFQVVHGKQRYCSDRCRDLTPVRVALPTRTILERDSWLCGLCGEWIDPDAKWPDAMSGVADHIYPWVEGGSNNEINLQAAHWCCNQRKHDSVVNIPQPDDHLRLCLLRWLEHYDEEAIEELYGDLDDGLMPAG